MKSKADFHSFGSTFSKAEHGQLKNFIDLRKLQRVNRELKISIAVN